jgi:hypothetical protein
MPELRISTDKVCWLVVKARELNAKVPPEELEDASNAADDDARVVLEDRAGDATEEEVRGFVADLNEEEIEDLTALMWLGRGDYEVGDWATVLRDVRAARGKHAAGDYLLGTPLLANYLEEGLATLGLSCDDFEASHL